MGKKFYFTDYLTEEEKEARKIEAPKAESKISSPVAYPKIKKIGIYAIVNKRLKKVYIGQSKNIMGRFAEHKSSLNNNKYFAKTFGMDELQIDWNKNKDSFEFIILKECDVNDLYRLETAYAKKCIHAGYYVYNMNVNTETTFLNCPKSMAFLMKEIILYIDKGFITEQDLRFLIAAKTTDNQRRDYGRRITPIANA